MAQPLVSVVVISYNQERYITQNLDSLKSQTYTNWELIVVDDASSDNSVEVFEIWLRENSISAKKIFHRQNTGLATVLNESSEICSGDYVKFIAADDYLHAECIEKSVRCLEVQGKEYGMVFTDTFCVDENNRSKPSIMEYSFLENISATELRNKLMQVNFIPALTVLMRTSSLKATGKYDSRFLVEDYFRWLSIGEKYLIAFNPEKLAYYRVHPGNVSKEKAHRINLEAKMIQLIFDHNGVVKDNINNFIEGMYLRKENIPLELTNLYTNYGFHRKMLRFCIRYKIPPLLYKFINRIYK